MNRMPTLRTLGPRGGFADRALAAAAVGLAGAIAACGTSTPTTVYTPITGIMIPSAAITAGHGCGMRPQQVYKYAAVITDALPEAGPPDGGTPDGVAPDGDLGDGAAAVGGTPDGGPAPFRASGVFDCFADAFFSNLPIQSGSTQAFDIHIFAFNADAFPSALNCSPGAPPCPGDDASAVDANESAATWTTTCTATEVLGVTAPATCNALIPSRATPSGDDAASGD